jgi:hypothetical protein
MLQIPLKILFSNSDNKVEEHLIETHTSHSEKVWEACTLSMLNLVDLQHDGQPP